MAKTTYSPRGAKNDITDKADVFDRPTILVNCIKYCPSCAELYPLLDDAFKSWLAAKGYALYVNKDDAKCIANRTKYGKTSKVGSTTPQFYAISGDKAVGVSPVRTGPWTAQQVRDIVGGLIAKING